MRRPKTPPKVRVEVTTEHTAEVRGQGVFSVLERLPHVPAQFSYRPPSLGSKCWLVPARHAADVEAQAERMGGSAVIDGQQVLTP